MPKAFVVANPMSGSVKMDVLRSALSRRLTAPWSYELHVLQQGRDVASEIARHVAEGVDIVVAAGGDGTVRAVASGLVGTDVELGVLPEGTANVLAHDTGIPLRLDDALALLTGPHEIMLLDVIQIDDIYAILNLSVGLSAGIIRDTDASDKRRYGMLAYVWAGAKNLLAVGVKDVALSIDGREHRLRATEVLIANCPSLGVPDLRVASTISPADGLLHVVAFRARHLGDYITIGSELLLRRPRSRRHIRVIRAESEITINTPESLDVQADGDLIGCTPVTARIIPGAVRLIVPRRQVTVEGAGA